MNHRDERLGSAPLGKLMFSLALPSVAAQLINVLYNIVDRMYIGHIPGYGNAALTGVGVTFPILTMISAFSAFAGMGGAPLASIQLGKQNRQRAEQILGNSAGLLVLFSVILTAFFSIFKTPVLYAFGASDATIVYARDYISIYLIGTIFVQLALGLNTYISGQGEAKIAMLSVLMPIFLASGSISRIILSCSSTGSLSDVPVTSPTGFPSLSASSAATGSVTAV
jgi:Na+-driven multidrug efflux pump